MKPSIALEKLLQGEVADFIEVDHHRSTTSVSIRIGGHRLIVDIPRNRIEWMFKLHSLSGDSGKPLKK